MTSIRAVCFDLGGVIVRTEHQAPREHLAQRLGLSYEKLVSLIFENESSRRASLGEISTPEHWQNITQLLSRPADEAERISHEFFAGDVIDWQLIDFIRSLRPRYKTGLISNAWPDLRDFIVKRWRFDDAFDEMIISAEVGLMKPDTRFYQVAMDRLGVTPAETVFIDDIKRNVETASAMGMRGILFCTPVTALEELEKILNNR